MSYQRKTGCPGLPKGLWWLLALSGLALLYFLMLSTRQQPIEAALQASVNEALSNQGMAWASATLESRGRDVLLMGSAPSETARREALELAQSVKGVRIVEGQIVVAPPVLAQTSEAATISPEIEIIKNDEGVTLKGALRSQADIDALIDATASALGEDNIVSELVVADVAGDTAWLSQAPEMLFIMAGMSSAHLNLSSRFSLFSGVVATAQQKANLINSAKRVLGGQMVSEIDVIPSTAPVLVADAEPIEAAPLAEGEADGVLITRDAKYVVSDSAETSAGASSSLPDCQARLDQAISGKRILFAFNDSAIKKVSYPILREIASVAKDCSEVFATHGLEVSGHTDNIGRQSYNLALSQKRAEAVTAYLVNLGVDARWMTSVGYGELKPVASNETEEGRSQNRRIDFTINETRENL